MTKTHDAAAALRMMDAISRKPVWSDFAARIQSRRDPRNAAMMNRRSFATAIAYWELETGMRHNARCDGVLSGLVDQEKELIELDRIATECREAEVFC